MRTLEEIKKGILYELEVTKNSWSQADTSLAQSQLEGVERIEENFDDYTKQRIAFECRTFVENYAKDNSLGLEINDHPSHINSFLQISKDEKIGKYLNDNRSNLKFIPDLAEQTIQSMYESFGYTDKLATRKEIDDLQRQYSSLPIGSEERDKLEKYIANEKRRSGFTNTRTNLETYRPLEDISLENERTY